MKHVIITGASGGIGKATAELLLQNHYRVSVCSRNSASLEYYAKFPGAFAMECDVRDIAGVKAFFAAASEHFGPVDVLVNNAGLGYFNKLADAPLEEWQEMVDTNIKGLLNCLHTALPGLIAQHGQIINLGSVAAHNVFPNSGIYCATKHAVLAISESIRLELADKLRITTISPGAVNTAFIDQTHNEQMKEQMTASFRSGMNPLAIARSIQLAIESEEMISEILIRPDKSR